MQKLLIALALGFVATFTATAGSVDLGTSTAETPYDDLWLVQTTPSAF